MKLFCKIAMLLTIAVLSTSPLLAQCSGGNCQVPWQRSPQQTPRAAQSSPVPTEQTGHFSSVVRIRNQEGARSASAGSGVLVNDDGFTFVLTCAHLFSDRVGDVTVRFANGKTSEAKVLKIDHRWDMAMLAVYPPGDGVTAVKLTDSLPKKGDTLTSCGFGSNSRFATNRGSFTRFCSPAKTGPVPSDWIELTGAARSGDSGGPIFDSRGRLAGILFGTDGRTVNGVWIGRVRLMTRPVLKGYRKAKSVVRRAVATLRVPLKIVRLLIAGRGNIQISGGYGQGPTQLEPYNGDRVLRPLPPPSQADPAASLDLDCRLFGGRKPTPAPPPGQVIVQADPEVADALNRINGKLDVLVQVNPPEVGEPPADDETLPPLAVAGLAIAALICGVLIFYVIQGN